MSVRGSLIEFAFAAVAMTAVLQGLQVHWAHSAAEDYRKSNPEKVRTSRLYTEAAAAVGSSTVESLAIKLGPNESCIGAARGLLSQDRPLEAAKVILAGDECLPHSITDKELNLDAASFSAHAAIRGRSFLTKERLIDVVAGTNLTIAETIVKRGLLVSDGRLNIPVAAAVFRIFREASRISCNHTLQERLAPTMEKCAVVIRDAGGSDLVSEALEEVRVSTRPEDHLVSAAAVRLLRTFPVSAAG